MNTEQLIVELEVQIVLLCKGLSVIGQEIYIEWLLYEWNELDLDRLVGSYDLYTHLAMTACSSGFRYAIADLVGDNLADVPDTNVKDFYLQRYTIQELADMLLAKSQEWSMPRYEDLSLHYELEDWKFEFEDRTALSFKMVVLDQLIEEYLPWYEKLNIAKSADNEQLERYVERFYVECEERWGGQ